MESVVSDYIPELANPVILDDIMAENSGFKPAKTAIRLKHLLNFSSGLFYVPRTSNPTHLSGVYSKPQNQDNPIGHFLSLIKVSLVLIAAVLRQVLVLY